MELATARIAFFAPRRLLMRTNCARRYPSFLCVAAHAALTSVGLSQGALCRVRVERRLPALSSSRWTEPGPRKQLAYGREAAHVGADFCDEDAGRRLADPRHGCHEADGGVKGPECISNARFNRRDCALEPVDLA